MARMVHDSEQTAWRLLEQFFALCGKRGAILSTVALAVLPVPAFAEAEVPQPRLVIVISIDQFGSALFGRYRERFDGGLARLTQGGVVYANAYQSHAVTETCPGHSTLLTGVHPNRTGIVGNAWIGPGAERETYCLASSTSKLAHDLEAEGRGPERLMATTLGDWMKTSGSTGRVVAVSGKDRGALTMGGHLADAWFWYDDDYRGFTTQVRPGEDATARLRPVAAFNTELRALIDENPPHWEYADPACHALEGSYTVGETTWRAQVPPSGWDGEEPVAAARSFRASPFLDLATLDLAASLIAQYELGADAVPDLLTISLSATDAIGHTYGTGGPEMCDHLARLDLALETFLDRVLDATPDALVVMTADHGGSDMPERLQGEGYPTSSRMDPTGFLRALNESVAGVLALDFAPFTVVGQGYKIDQLYFARAAIERLTPEVRARAIAHALEWLHEQPEVVAAHARDKLLADTREARRGEPMPVTSWPEALTLQQRMALSAYPARSGDIMVAYQPLDSTIPPLSGFYLSGHGSPWDYDRRVPLIFFSHMLHAEERPYAVETVDIAPTLAAIMRIPVPGGLDGHCLPLPRDAVCPTSDDQRPASDGLS